MGLTKRSYAGFALVALASPAAESAPSAELLDLAARVHYGYYHGDARTIDAAAAALERLGESPEAVYYRDFAALRRAQLGGMDRPALTRLNDCAEREIPAGVGKAFAADAWILAAACALMAGDDRGSAEALARARSFDADNPRIGLVEAWALDRAAAADPAQRDALATRLQGVVAAFDAWTPSIDDPDWGHAEALTALAATALERGQLRAARDLVERALLLAPEYRTAVELRAAMQGTRIGDRAL